MSKVAKKLKSFLIPPELIKIIQQEAEKKEISQNMLLEQILRDWLRNKNKLND